MPRRSNRPDEYNPEYHEAPPYWPNVIQDGNFVLDRWAGSPGSSGAGPREPYPSERVWGAITTRSSGFLQFVERRRLKAVLAGDQVLIAQTPEGPRRAVVHRHWLGLAIRLTGLFGVLMIAILVSPVILALPIMAACHAGLLFLRRGLDRRWAIWIPIGEVVLGLLALWAFGPEWLRALLILAVVLMALLTVMGWHVDMELVTDTNELIRTRGLFLLTRTVKAPLTSLRIADIVGPFFGLGLVSVDTTSDRDQMLHNFGLIAKPNEWAALLLREGTRR